MQAIRISAHGGLEALRLADAVFLTQGHEYSYVRFLAEVINGFPLG